MFESPLRIAIADDHALLRDGLKSVLQLQADMQVVGEAGSVDDVMRLLDTAAPDILLLDLQMDRNTLTDIPSFSKKTSVIVVTAHDTAEAGLAALRGGARGVIFKRFAAESLVECVLSVGRGEVWMPPSLQTHVAAGLREPLTSVLTPREREITRYVAVGLRNSEVARKLFISEQTVKTHLNNIFQKLAVRDRVELTLYALRTGMVDVHEQHH